MSYNNNGVGARSQKYLALKKVWGYTSPHFVFAVWLQIYRIGKSMKDVMRMSSKGLNCSDGRSKTL